MSLIVADIGGTNARLAFQEDKNSEIKLIEKIFRIIKVIKKAIKKPAKKSKKSVTPKLNQSWIRLAIKRFKVTGISILDSQMV